MPGAVSRLLRRARAAGRRAGVRRRRRRRLRPPRPIRAFLERVKHPYATALIDELQHLQRDHHRPHVPRLVRPLLEGRQGPRHAGRARAVARGADGGRGAFAGGAGALAAGQRRAPRGQDLVPAAAGQAPGAPGLDRVRGQRRRPDGGPAVVRPARGPHPARARGAGGRPRSSSGTSPTSCRSRCRGTHQGQAASILDQILPAIAAGRLIVWTEASPASTARLLRLRPALRSAARGGAAGAAVAGGDAGAGARAAQPPGREAAGLPIDPGCVETALGSARQYLSAGSFPGPVLDLIKLTVGRAAKDGSERGRCRTA